MTDIEKLQQELQEILEELKTLTPASRAPRHLSEEKATIEAELRGSGAIAQGDNAKAVRAGGQMPISKPRQW